MNISVRRKKLRLGLLYGLAAGFAFALLAWGADGFALARANASLPCIKFLPAVLICSLTGALAGWLTMYFEKHAIAALLWAALAFIYSWLVIWIPFTSTPYLLEVLNPSLAEWIDYGSVQDLYQFRLFRLVIIGLAALLTGLLQINLVHQALHASGTLGVIVPILVCAFLLALGGSAADNMINLHLREPVQVIDNVIQFAAENDGVEVDPRVARKIHLSAVNQVRSLIHKDRHLSLIHYDQNLGMIDILVDFEGILVKCTSIYAQPTDCVLLNQNP